MRRVLPLLVLVLLAAAAGLHFLGGEGPGPGAGPAAEPQPSGPTDAPVPVDLSGYGPESSATGDRRDVAPSAAEPGRAPRATAGDPTLDGAASGGALLVGRLVGPEGVPVGDADVQALAQGGPFGPRGRGERRSARSDAEGHFRVRVPAGPLSLAVRAADHAPWTEQLHLCADETFDLGVLVLAAGARVRGRVLDDAGRPAAGVAVHELGEPGPFGRDEGPQRTVTDADGRFELPGVGVGPFALRLRHERHPDLDAAGEVEAPGRAVEFELRLAPGASIEGVVREVPSDAPTLEVVARSLAREEPSPGRMVMRADGGPTGGPERAAPVAADGTFVVQGLVPEEPHELLLRTAGGGEAWSAPVQAPAGDRGVVLVADPGSRISWRAVDARSGEPVERYLALVGFGDLRPATDAEGRVARQHEDGRRDSGRLRAPSPGARATLRLEAPGYAPLVREGLGLSSGVPLDLGDLPLTRAATLTARVTDDAGRPVEGAELRLGSAADPGAGRTRLRVQQVGDSVLLNDQQLEHTGPDGVARLTLPTGARAVDLSVRHPDHAVLRLGGLEVDPGEDLELPLTLVRGATARVLVRDPAGEPLQGAKVEHRAAGPSDPLTDLGGFARRVDVAGRVTFDGLAPGTHHFRVARDTSSGGFRFRVVDEELPEPESWIRVELAAGETREVRLEVAGSGTLSGLVLEDGVPLAGAQVNLLREGDTRAAEQALSGSGPGADTDGAGRYRVRDLPVGRYDLEVRHSGRSMPHRVPVEVRGGEQTLDLDLPVTVLSGRVLDDQGEPAVGAKVLARRDGPDRRPRMITLSATSDGSGPPTLSMLELGAPTAVTTDAEGRFRLRGVEGGRELVLEASLPGFRKVYSEPVRAPEGGERDGVELRLERGGALEVVLEGAQEGATYMVHCEWAVEGEQREPKVQVLVDGRTTVEDLDPGVWRVSISDLMGSGGDEEPIPPATFEVQRGETTLARFER